MEEERKELREKARALRLKDAALRSRARRLEASIGKVLGATGKLTMCVVYALAGWQHGPAIALFLDELRKRRLPLWDEEEVALSVEAAFREIDLDVLDKVWASEDAKHTLILRRAWRGYTAWQLRAWVERQNIHHSAAPSTEQVIQQYRCVQALVPETLRWSAVQPVNDRKGRMWSTRWRRHWGCAYTSMSTREDITMELTQMKAEGCFHVPN